MHQVQIAPSILSSDFGRLNEEIASVDEYADLIHCDVMDGHFVPNLTFGPPIIKKIKSKLPLDVHLMTYHPEMYYEALAEKGVYRVHVQVEAVPHLHRQIQKIKDLGMKASAVLNPATSLCMIEHVLEDLDCVLIMSVNPGFGGQKFIQSVLPKIKELRSKAPDINIMVDGGINAETAKLVVEAGANILVAGSHIFKSEDRKAAIDSLRV